jgi:dipeptidyl aminopeptidase/acylaminoacyl peptidase
MKIRLLLLLSCLWAAVMSAAAAGRAITHEDLWRLKRVGAPAVSPDGKWVVVTVTEPAYDAKEQSADLWLMAADGSVAPRKITQTKAPETGAKWSPDSSRLAFSSKRDGDEAAQIYVINLVRGGEAERITQLVNGARSPEWSPDGARLLFVSEAFPGATDEDANKRAAKAQKDHKYNARVYEGFPIKYWDRWLDDKKAHLFVQDAQPGAKPRDLLAHTKLAELPGFAGRQLDAGEDLPATWAPGGKSVVFVAATTRNRSAFEAVPTQLFEVSVDGGEPRQLTSDKNSYGDPKYTADGKKLLALVETGGDGKTYHHNRITSFGWPFDSRQQVLTADFDRSIVGFETTDDGQLLFSAETGTGTTLFTRSLNGGAAKPVDLHGGCVTGLAVGGPTLVANWESASQPPEPVVIDLKTGATRRLTHFNDAALQTLELPRPDRFEFQGPKGFAIESLVIKPAGFDPAKKYPLLVLLHGGPTPQWKDQWVLRWNYHLLAAPGYIVLLPNYSGSTGYSEAFGQAIQSDPLRGPANEINAAADEAIKRFSYIDGARQAAAGASYGGHLANWMEATTTRYKCLIEHAGLVNLETQWATSDGIFHRELNNGGPVWEQGPIWREQSPVRLIASHFNRTGWVTPMLVSGGEKDFRVPVNNAYENWSYLQRLQIPSKLIIFPEENHWVLNGENSRFWFGEVHAWLAKWLKAES